MNVEKVPASLTFIVALGGFILAGIGMLNSMNEVSQTDAIQLEKRVSLLEAENRALKRDSALKRSKLQGRHVFMNDAGSRVEFLCSKDPECRPRFGPMRIPE